MVLYGTQELKARNDAETLLSIAVWEQWGMDKLPDRVRGERGKPRFVGAECREFNLSHSQNLALCALDTCPVGVDIQVIRTWRTGLPERVCSGAEWAWLEQQPDRQRALTLLWALKECRVKQSGEGLTHAIREISIPIPQGETGIYRRDGLWFRTYAGENWMGAVCGSTAPPEEILWRGIAHE
jgi:4'-phosphopantetheinyl transferase